MEQAQRHWESSEGGLHKQPSKIEPSGGLTHLVFENKQKIRPSECSFPLGLGPSFAKQAETCGEAETNEWGEKEHWLDRGKFSRILTPRQEKNAQNLQKTMEFLVGFYVFLRN